FLQLGLREWACPDGVSQRLGPARSGLRRFMGVEPCGGAVWRPPQHSFEVDRGSSSRGGLPPRGRTLDFSIQKFIVKERRRDELLLVCAGEQVLEVAP